ncbi:hypothetical protein FLAG1_11573 [Fusarium langsethiae]|uniref:Uncharacterized protein n=1 Tax=Fusarium langsethiae TaxID=179993 RepID=A0A0M9EME3_FUSLA|nr:hypothetical protein FLAG1_11573 [Fusarium langsethiae]GKU10781.1 unnamed protein product [Fusarium langsethiae]GKU13180.1 unnamed protein product [Fusarium langsethiae]
MDENDNVLEAIVWPEYGERKPVTRLADEFGSIRLFHTASEMLYHVETGHQTEFLWKTPDEVFNSVDRCDDALKLYNHETNLWYCPNCKGTQQGICKSLSFMVRHAESNLCGLKVCSGPIAELKEAVEGYAVRKWLNVELGR